MTGDLLSVFQVVEKGTITRNLDPDSLRRRMTGSLDEARPSNGRRHIPGHNVPAAPLRRIFELRQARATRTPGQEPRAQA